MLGDINTVVSKVPLTEGLGINLDNRILHKGVGTDQLVVGGIVHNSDNSNLLGDGFRSPAEVSVVQTKSTVLDVSTTATNRVDLLVGKKPGHGWRTSQLKLSLLADGDMTP